MEGLKDDSHGVAFYRFFLAGGAARPELNKAAGLHPNAVGVEVIAAAIGPVVKRRIEGD